MSQADYSSALRAAFYGLWKSVLTYDQFVESMLATIERGLTDAWRVGLKDGGISLDEQTAEERIRLQQLIHGQYNYVGGVAEFIEVHQQEKGGKWGTVYNRLKIWANYWREVMGIASAMAAANKKKKFVRVKDTEEPCRSCDGLEGRVYRNSVWLANDAVPPSRNFECKGYHCGHALEATDERITPGPFPRRLLDYE